MHIANYYNIDAQLDSTRLNSTQFETNGLLFASSSLEQTKRFCSKPTNSPRYRNDFWLIFFPIFILRHTNAQLERQEADRAKVLSLLLLLLKTKWMMRHPPPLALRCLFSSFIHSFIHLWNKNREMNRDVESCGQLLASRGRRMRLLELERIRPAALTSYGPIVLVQVVKV